LVIVQTVQSAGSSFNRRFGYSTDCTECSQQLLQTVWL